MPATQSSPAGRTTTVRSRGGAASGTPAPDPAPKPTPAKSRQRVKAGNPFSKKSTKPHRTLRLARTLMVVLALALVVVAVLSGAQGLFGVALLALMLALLFRLHIKSRSGGQRHLPHGFTEPTRGPRRLFWKSLLQPTYNYYGRSWALLEPSLDEQIDQARKDLQGLTDGENGIQATIVEANQKGGSGKSTDTASSACTIGETTGQSIVVVDNNQTKGNTASRLGVGKTLTIRAAMRQLGSNFTHAKAIRYLGHHPVYRNVYVVDSDDAKGRKTQPISDTEYRDLVLQLKREFHSVLFDFGNNLDAIQTEVALDVADVLRFVAVPWIENSVEDCRDTMEHFRDGHPDKVANSVIVISGHKKGDPDVVYYAEYFNHPAEQIVLIPFDPVFKPLRTKGSPEEQVRVVDHANFRRRTLLANLRRDILTLQRAGIAQRATAQELDASTASSSIIQPGETVSTGTSDVGTPPASHTPDELVSSASHEES